MTKDQAQALVGLLIAGFPRTAIEPETVEVYIAAVSELRDAERAKTTVEQLIRASRWFPSVAEIRDLYQRETEWAPSGKPQIEAVASGPRELPPEIREYVDNLRLRDIPDAEQQAKTVLAALPPAGTDKCDDCGKKRKRFRYGARNVCRECAAARTRVRTQVEA